MKKIMAIITAVVLLASVFAMSASAAGTNEFSLSAKVVEAGKVEVTLSVSGVSTGIASFGPFALNYDTSKVSIAKKDITVLSETSVAADWSYNMMDADGMILIVYMDDDGGRNPIAADGALLKFTFTVKDGATAADFSLDKDEGSIIDKDKNELDFSAEAELDAVSLEYAEATTTAPTTTGNQGVVTTTGNQGGVATTTGAPGAVTTTKGPDDTSNPDTGVVAPFAVLALAAAAGVVLVKTKK